MISVLTNQIQASKAFGPPPHFAVLLTHPALIAVMGYSEQMALDLEYVQHLRNNTLEHVITALQLCTVSDLIDRQSFSAKLSHQYCQDILNNHAKLIQLEEIQTKVDVAQYDLHYVSLKAEIAPVTSAQKLVVTPACMIAKFKIQGSSENRPKISLGGAIMLRPVEEDLHKLEQFGWLPNVFEIRGVCIHYQLSTEVATFEFPATIPGSIIPFEKIFNALRYHIRFEFDRFGFLFMQWAIGNILSDPYLSETLFPNEATISRLQSYFAAHRLALSRDVQVAPPGLNSKAAAIRRFVFDINKSLGVSSAQDTDTLRESIAASPTMGSSKSGMFNAQQQHAIDSIVVLANTIRWGTVQSSYTATSFEGYLPLPPFIIYGPPGTGIHP